MGHPERISFRWSWDYWAIPFAIGARPYNSLYEVAFQIGPLGISILIGDMKDQHHDQ